MSWPVEFALQTLVCSFVDTLFCNPNVQVFAFFHSTAYAIFITSLLLGVLDLQALPQWIVALKVTGKQFVLKTWHQEIIYFF